MKKERTSLRLSELEPNTGQIEWLPKNPRQWTQDDIDRTAKSIAEDYDFLEDRPLLAVPHDGRFVVFAGNLRMTAARQGKVDSVPVIVYTVEDDADQQTILRRAMKDNGSFGAWDWDALANEWDDLPLGDWGVPAWKGSEEGDGEGSSDADVPAKEKIEEVEALLNEAMRENVRESLAQIEHGMQKGWLCTFLTKGLAQAKFIRAKYYGEHYPQWMSFYFCPQRLWTAASDKSPFEQMTNIANGADAGIAGLRTLSGDHLLLLLLLKGSYPFGSARMPIDFPANKAAELIREFGGEGCSVLDPCHGWGGRLVGALLADVGLYVGVDPSDEAGEGVRRAADAFLPYCEGTKVEFIRSPFEDADLGGRQFDFALTSPPYFDVEKYHGEGQSHTRYGNYKAWVDGFYRRLITKTYESLKRGGVFCLQVGSQTYPLLDDGKDIAREVGFIVEEIRPLGGGASSPLHSNTDEDDENEKIIVLRK